MVYEPSGLSLRPSPRWSWAATVKWAVNGLSKMLGLFRRSPPLPLRKSSGGPSPWTSWYSRIPPTVTCGICDSLAAPPVGQDGAVDEAPRYRRPPMAWLALEAPRAGAEMALLGASLPRLARAPKGDGHPVLVLPGFIAGDDST